MASTTGSIKVSVFDASRQLWRGPEVRLKLTDPFTSSSNKTLVDQTIKKGVNTVSLEAFQQTRVRGISYLSTQTNIAVTQCFQLSRSRARTCLSTLC
jgi:hypothetical protein